MLEIPNCSIKKTSKTTLEGAEETYLSGKLVLEGDLTEGAAEVLGCRGAIRDNLPAFTVPKTRLREGGDDKHPHALDLGDGNGGGLALPNVSVHAMQGKVREGLATLTVTATFDDVMSKVVSEFHGDHPSFVGTLRVSPAAEPGQAQMGFEDETEQAAT